jgi:hypothetical protein
MKKLIILLSSFLVFSCGKVKEVEKVIRVEEFSKGRFSITTDNYYFYTDSLYRVGDTLKIGKKEIKWK